MWPFDQPENCAVILSRSIIDDGRPILFVSHDEDDHGWQFLDGSDPPSAPMVVLLVEATEIDLTLVELADLPPGWIAHRASIDHKWTRAPHP